MKNLSLVLATGLILGLSSCQNSSSDDSGSSSDVTTLPNPSTPVVQATGTDVLEVSSGNVYAKGSQVTGYFRTTSGHFLATGSQVSASLGLSRTRAE